MNNAHRKKLAEKKATYALRKERMIKEYLDRYSIERNALIAQEMYVFNSHIKDRAEWIDTVPTDRLWQLDHLARMNTINYLAGKHGMKRSRISAIVLI